MANERYFQATMTGFTGVVNVSAEFVGELVKSQISGERFVEMRGVQGRMVQGEVRCEVDPSALLYTEATDVVLTLEDVAGVTDLEFTLPKVEYKGMSIDAPSEDTKPMAFGVKFEAEIPVAMQSV